nr:hypothetical protein Iba_chr12bCG4450 [Ipomoea batatas]
MGDDCLRFRFAHNICGPQLDGWTWPTCTALHSSFHLRNLSGVGEETR